MSRFALASPVASVRGPSLSCGTYPSSLDSGLHFIEVVEDSPPKTIEGEPPTEEPMFLECSRRDASQSVHISLAAISPFRWDFATFFRVHASHPVGRLARSLWWESIGGLVGKSRPTKPTNLCGWYCSSYWNRAILQKPLDTDGGLARTWELSRFPVFKSMLVGRAILRTVDLSVRNSAPSSR